MVPAVAYEHAADDWWKKPLIIGLAVCVVLYLALGGGGALDTGSAASRPAGGVARGGATRYGCMMDAGSTGSRIHIYRFAQRLDGSLELEDEVFKQLKPGVSSFAGEPHKAALSIQPLLDEAFKTVPAAQRATTPIALYATAGLRLLPVPGQSDAILEELRGALAASPFQFDQKDVAITQGKLEGVFAWTTVNFLLGNLDAGSGSGSSGTAGIIDLGGGTTQVVFEPAAGTRMDAIAHADTHAMMMGGKPHELFAHSYLGYGLNSVAKKIRAAGPPGGKHPCYPVGHVSKAEGVDDVTGSGDAVGCATLIKQCVHSLEPELGMKLVTSPPSAGAEFYVFSYFYDRLVEGYGLVANQPLSLDDIDAAAHVVCKLTVEEVSSKYPMAESAEKFCMDVSFCAVLLREGYGLTAANRLTLAKKINNVETAWTLGAMLDLLS